jgi:hypothetical protein
MIHYSKKDWWLVGLVLAAIFIPLVLGAFFLVGGSPSEGLARSLLIIGTLTGAAVLLTTYPLYYQVTSSELIVRCGVLMRRHISLTAIDEVAVDRDPVSGPAWSLDRLRVSYRKDSEQTFIMISPRDKLSFLQELAANDAGLQLRGDRLIREQEVRATVHKRA